MIDFSITFLLRLKNVKIVQNSNYHMHNINFIGVDDYVGLDCFISIKNINIFLPLYRKKKKVDH